MMSLPACQQQALDRIEQTLAAEDPGLELRAGMSSESRAARCQPGQAVKQDQAHAR